MKATKNDDNTKGPRQLYRPRGSLMKAFEFLERPNLTPEDVVEFCRRSSSIFTSLSSSSSSLSLSSTVPVNIEPGRNTDLNLFYAQRRRVIEQRHKLASGHARLDPNGRVVPVNNPHAPPAVDLPPPPPAAHAVPAAAAGNNNNMAFMEPEDAETLYLAQQERIAAQTVARAVARYQKAGISLTDLQLVRIDVRQPRRQNHHHHHQQPPTFTFRRVCTAVLGILLAFLCLMLHTLPIGGKLFSYHGGSTGSKVGSNSIGTRSSGNYHYEAWLSHQQMADMHQLLNVRDYHVHVKECGSHLDRNVTQTWWQQAWSVLYSNAALLLRQKSPLSSGNCANGVLWIPTVEEIRATTARRPKTDRDAVRDEETASAKTSPVEIPVGVDTAWFFPCQKLAISDVSSQNNKAEEGGISLDGAVKQVEKNCSAENNVQAVCVDEQEEIKTSGDGASSLFGTRETKSTTLEPASRCFRGVHDYVVNATEIAKVLVLGTELILKGHDHFDIYHANSGGDMRLEYVVPTVVSKIKNILIHTYQQPATIQPMAFRIQAVAPTDGTGVTAVGGYTVRHVRGHKHHRLVGLLNLTNYVDFLERVAHVNELVSYSALLSRLLGVQPYRDACLAMADRQAHPDFHLHTLLYLSRGSGHDYHGGASLFVDEYDGTNKMKRGLAVDGSPGRLIVSTGGLENTRCRLPVTGGIRVVLQIWWM